MWLSSNLQHVWNAVCGAAATYSISNIHIYISIYICNNRTTYSGSSSGSSSDAPTIPVGGAPGQIYIIIVKKLAYLVQFSFPRKSSIYFEENWIFTSEISFRWWIDFIHNPPPPQATGFTKTPRMANTTDRSTLIHPLVIDAFYIIHA